MLSCSYTAVIESYPDINLPRTAITRRRLLQGISAIIALSPNCVHPQPRKTWRIGYLGDGLASARAASTLEPFREGLRDLGYVEGRNMVLEVRWSEGKTEKLAEFAAEFVSMNVDVIVAHGVPGATAAKNATPTIPIVIATVADMVGAGLVSSLARPGGNITGTSDQITEISSKEIEVLGELLPNLRRAAVLWNRKNPGAKRTTEALQEAARERGWRVMVLGIDGPDEIETIVESAVRDRAEALIVVHDPLVLTHRARIANAALKNNLPTICAAALFAEAGGLVSYGPDLIVLYRRASVFVDRILKGAKPADIPVEQPTKFEFVMNMKTAKALGIRVPQSILLRANRVIE